MRATADPIVQVVTRSGGREFHGTGYEYIRNEALNATDFFNNRNSVKRPALPVQHVRRNARRADLHSGPLEPGPQQDVLLLQRGAGADLHSRGRSTTYTMPTALERQGDFSQTLDVNGKVIPITDTLTGAPFPGNVIPKARLNPNGLALMNVLPQPNFFNRAISGGNYNYQIQEVQKWPKRSQLLRLDFVPTDKDRFFVRGKTWVARQQGYAVAGGAEPGRLLRPMLLLHRGGSGASAIHTSSART